MNRQLTRQSLLLVLALGVMGVAWRLWPHAPNVAPVAALALFAAWATGRAWVGAALAIGVLAVSDLILGRLADGFSYDPALQAIVWGALALPAVFARFLPRRAARAFAWAIVPALASSAAFFLITNGAVWALGTSYPPTPGGLVAAYVAGIPFLRPTLIGDAAFTLALFGGAALTSVSLSSTRRTRGLRAAPTP